MNNDVGVTVVVPSYLEEENLRILLPRLVSVLSASGVTFEVLVLDTESPMDNTKDVCSQFGVSYVARRGGNRYGDAVRTGLALARGTWTIFMDADGSHSPEFCLKLLERRDEASVVIASRYIPGGSTDNSGSLILMSKVVNLVYSVVLGLRCHDVSNSFKLYRTELYKSLELRCNNFDIVEELLYKIRKNNPKALFLEIPFTFKERMFGHTKRDLVAFILTYVVTLFRLRLGK